MVTDSPDCSEEMPEDGNADGAGDPSETIATLARASASTADSGGTHIPDSSGLSASACLSTIPSFAT